jgi:hypothetical protein
VARAPQPRSCLNPHFVTAVLLSPIKNQELARLAGFAQPGHFSQLLHAVYVVPSLKTAIRLEVVARMIGFEGKVLLEERPPVTADAYSLDSLPGPGVEQ